MTGQSTKTAAMVNQRKKESKTKRKTVMAIIEAMERTGALITVAEVARRANVSPWLVRRPSLLQELTKAQKRMLDSESPVSTEQSPGSYRVERDLLRQENQKLRLEVGNCRRRISEMLGARIDGTDAHSQSVRAQELDSQNEVLIRQASEARQELEQLTREMTALSSDLEAAHTVNRSLMTELNRVRT